MIEKERSKPELIFKLEALIKRCSELEPRKDRILSEFNKRSAGYKGEQKLDYYLSFLDEKEYCIFHGLRLWNGKYFIQIDTLLLTRKFAFILEVKNWKGVILFDPQFHQLIRIQNEKEEAFHDPISQAEHQSWQLKNWLKVHGFPGIPIEYSVVISNPTTIVKTSSNQHYISNKVIHAHRLVNKILSVEKMYTAEKLNDKEMKKLSKTLLKRHTMEEIDILKYFNINPDAILTGVHCPNCSALPMIFHWGKWHCSSCKTSSSTAHHQAVKDYFLLIKPTITNAEFRKFTHTDSVFVASKLLSHMELPYKGEKSMRVYSKWVK